MAVAEKYLPRYTYEDWINWKGRWELIEGYPVAMSPTPIPEHQRVAAEIKTELIVALRKAKCKHCKAYDPIDYKISATTILEPDALIVCGKITKSFLDFPPALVVEVLSKSTALKDRNIKYELYQQQGVHYYLMVDTHKRSIEVNELINGAYKLRQPNEYTFHFVEACTINPELDNIWNED